MSGLSGWRSWCNWANVSRIHQSPVARLAAFMPVAGYLLLFSEALPNVADYVKIDDGFRVFSTECRLRLLYFGGVFVALSTVAHFCLCPKFPKLYVSRRDWRDQFMRSGSSSEVTEAISDAVESSYLFNKSSESRENFLVRLERYVLVLRGASAQSTIESRQYQDLIGMINNNASGDKDMWLDIYTSLTGRLERIYYEDLGVAKNEQKKQAAFDVLEAVYLESNGSRPRWLLVAFSLALLGGFAMLLPAIETLLLVLVSLFTDQSVTPAEVSRCLDMCTEALCQNPEAEFVCDGVEGS